MNSNAVDRTVFAQFAKRDRFGTSHLVPENGRLFPALFPRLFFVHPIFDEGMNISLDQSES